MGSAGRKRIPPIVVIHVPNGGDAQGHERGREYDNMAGDYATYIEDEVLPRVEKRCQVRLTKNPDGRAAMGTGRASVERYGPRNRPARMSPARRAKTRREAAVAGAGQLVNLTR